MNLEEALKLLRGGPDGVQEWNRRRKDAEEIPSLREADLSGADLRVANLSVANLSEANLSGANLSGADLRVANLAGAKLNEANLTSANSIAAVFKAADLSRANLHRANLNGANLCGADLRNADLSRAEFSAANLSGADLSGADLSAADLRKANLREADLRKARVSHTLLRWTCFDDTDLSQSRFSDSILADVDLSQARGLESVDHLGPSTIGLDTLVRSKGRIPEKFLRGCGLQEWEILSAKLHDPSLTPFQIADILTDIQSARANKPLFTGVFMSYSHDDLEFVLTLYDRLDEKTQVYLDEHDMTAGPVQEQIGQAIRLHDVLILVLSEASIKSDWVLHELEVAHEKEKDGQHVLCPVAIDGAWKDKLEDVYWKPVFRKHVLDFSKWRDKAEIDKQFEKLWSGLRTWYGKGQVDAVT